MAAALIRPLWRAIVLAGATWAVGGWAVVTLDDLPDSAVAGAPLMLSFTVRQHGVHLLDGLKPSVEAVSGSRRVRVEAASAGSAGHYSAALTLPDTGSWSVTVHSGFGNNQVQLPPIAAVARGQSIPPIAQSERGKRLFVAKGCVTCHLHGDVPGSGTVAVGPELTSIRLPADFLQKFLADPSIGPVPANGTLQMPNLNLKPGEIAALTAFINKEGTAARAGF